MSTALPTPLPGTFEARQIRVGSIMRELADRHEARTASASGLSAVADFLVGRALATDRAKIEAAIRRVSDRN